MWSKKGFVGALFLGVIIGLVIAVLFYWKVYAPVSGAIHFITHPFG